MTRPRALIFDMDGLLVDTEPMYWNVGRELARRHGKRPLSDAALRRMMGRSRLDSTRILIDEALIDGFEPDALLALREELMLECYARGVEPMPGVREILERFHG